MDFLGSVATIISGIYNARELQAPGMLNELFWKSVLPCFLFSDSFCCVITPSTLLSRNQMHEVCENKAPRAEETLVLCPDILLSD